MATTRKTSTLDPTKICMLALRQVKTASDYYQIETSNPAETFTTAWNTLHESDQHRITGIVNNDTQPAPQAIADELAASGSKIQLESLKSSYGDAAVKSAWRLLPQQERDRIKSLCDHEQEEELAIVTETPDTYRVEPQSQVRKTTLINLTADLQELDDLLDNLDGENITAELQTAVDELLSQRDETQEAIATKLDNYCSLVQSRLMWATARKAESERLAKLADADFKTVEFLRSRLKSHLDSTGKKKLRTARFNISICANGGKAPLRFDDTAPEQMPVRFQRATVEPNREAIRAALEQCEDLQFAYLGEREHHLRIK